MPELAGVTTVTAKLALTDAPWLSVAVTVTVALPTPTGVTVGMPATTETVAVRMLALVAP